MPKKLSEYTTELTPLSPTNKILVAGGTPSTDYYTTPAGIATYVANPTFADDADATAFISRLTGTYTDLELAAINTFFHKLKNRTLHEGGSQYASLDALYLMFLDNQVDSLLNIKSTSYTMTAVNSPTFTSRRGIKLNGTTQYLNPNINVATLAGADSHLVLGFYNRSIETGADRQSIFAANDNTNFFEFNFELDNGTNFYDDRNVIFNAGGGTYSVAIASGKRSVDTRGCITVSCHGRRIFLQINDNILSYGTAAGSDNPTIDLPNFNAYLGVRSIDGVVDGSAIYYAKTFYSSFWIGFGKNWLPYETSAFHNDLKTLMKVFGANQELEVSAWNP